MSAPQRKKLKIITATILIAGLSYLLANHFELLPGLSGSDNPTASSSGAKGARMQGMRPLPPVRVVQVTRGNLLNQLTSIGTITATNTVNVMSRINGELISVLFKEGQFVKAGDPLFKIDPLNFEIALSQAEGQLIKDQANLENAKADLSRLLKLQNQGGVSEQNITTQRALIRQLEGTVKTSQALVDKAALELSYTEIKAPIDGKTSLVDISVGNFIQSNTQVLTTLTQVEPIDILFSLPERHIREVQESINASPIHIEIWDSFLTEKLGEAKVISINNQIDTSTGTLQIRAQSANQDNKLFPNQFVNLKINLSEQKGALILPFNAIQNGAEGPFVWKVMDKSSQADADLATHTEQAKPSEQNNNPQERMKVVQRVPVQLGFRHNDSIIVQEGVKEGDVIVTDGVDKLTNGTSVNVVEETR